MIYGLINDKIVSAEEYLIDLELRKAQHICINHSVLNVPIRFDNMEVDAFILDAIGNKLIIQPVLPLKEKFDDKLNAYKTSYIRKLLNSDSFLSRFNPEFVKHIKETTVNTEDDTTDDNLWLLSHEEINQSVDFLRLNNNIYAFDLFEHTDMRSYSEMLLKLNNQKCGGWRLRSAFSDPAYYNCSRYVGYVDDIGDVDYSNVDHTTYGAVLPACTIC